jgi:hypothetical protein
MSTIEERRTESSSDSDTWVKSYTYLRTAMVALLIGLAAAVVWQTGRQRWHLLGSVSAYYYTPAQAIFVGALIGLGACMIALKGTRPWEEVWLNLGGMFAAVVAIVPTSRDEDYRRALAVCKQAPGQLLTQKASTGLDCPSYQALEAAATANVQNNMAALLVVGALALLATLLFTGRDRWSNSRVDGNRVKRILNFLRGFASALRMAGKSFWGAFGVALAVWAVGAVALSASPKRLIDNAHYIAAFGLVVCIIGVAVVNRGRHRDKQPGTALGGQTKDRADRGEPDVHAEQHAADRGLDKAAAHGPTGLRAVPAAVARERYTGIALAMLVVTPVLTVLWLPVLPFHVITLFWLEIFVAALFIVFWMVQTIELLPPRDRAPAPEAAP